MSTTNSDTGSDTGSPPETKRPNLDCGESSNQMVVPVEAPNQEISTYILGLNYDYFEMIFKWLSLKDLLNIRLTCKQLKEYADIYIRATYPKFTFGYGRVKISHIDIHLFRQLAPQLAKLIKRIDFRNICVYIERLDALKPILSQIDVLEMHGVYLGGFHLGQFNFGEFHESIFQFCPNVKHLIIKGIKSSLIIGKDNTWLQRTYPNLESVRFDNDFHCYKTHMKSDVKVRLTQFFRINPNVRTSTTTGEFRNHPNLESVRFDNDCCTHKNTLEHTDISIKELAQFFQLNPNVRTFATTGDFFSENCKSLLESDVTFDMIKIRETTRADRDNYYTFAALKDLHAKGAYKRLQLHDIAGCQNELNRIGEIPAVEALYFRKASYAFVIPPKMTDLKEIGFMDSQFIKSPDLLAQNLINIQRIYIQFARSIDIIPFIRYSVNVKVLYLNHCQSYGKVVFDVVAMNGERTKLDGACKMTIYVEEEIYLANKRATLPTKCSLVELDRAETYRFEKPIYC